MEINIIPNDNGVTGKLAGSLDTLSASVFEEHRTALEAVADKTIVLDCGELTYISSSGLRQFLILRKAVEAKGGSLTLRNLNEDIMNVFAMTGFNRLFKIE